MHKERCLEKLDSDGALITTKRNIPIQIEKVRKITTKNLILVSFNLIAEGYSFMNYKNIFEVVKGSNIISDLLPLMKCAES